MPVYGAGSLRFKLWAGLIGNGSPPLRHFLERKFLDHRRINAGPAPRGAFRGRAPQTKIVPPQARTVPRRN